MVMNHFVRSLVLICALMVVSMVFLSNTGFGATTIPNGGATDVVSPALFDCPDCPTPGSPGNPPPSDPGGPGAPGGPPAVTTAVPTLTEWGMIIFMLLAGMMAMGYLKKQKS
jgi:hypothetical protein